MAHNLWAVVFNNTNLLAIVIQLSSVADLTDQEVLDLIAVQTEDDGTWSLSRGQFSC